MDLSSYITGYVDGEGCFCISFQPSKRHALGWEVRPSFSVSQNADRAEILHLLKETWNSGNIRPDRSDKTLKFEVRKLEDLMNVVIPHFESYPMISAKQNDFELFKQICGMVNDGQHRTKPGLAQIVKLAMKMNPSGKRKYCESEILKSL